MHNPSKLTWLAAALLSAATTTTACMHHIAGLNTRDMPGWEKTPVEVQIRDVARPKKTKVALTNVRVFDGYSIRRPSTVIIDGEFISNDSRNVDSTVDGNGGVLIPGLIESHAHPETISHLETLSSYGITTVMSMSCSNDTICDPLRNQVGLASFYSSLVPATAPNSSTARIFAISPNNLVSSPDQASGFVSEAIRNGSDFIKLFAEAGGYSQDTHNAFVAAAHKAGKKVATHASDFTSYSQAIESGTDWIQHSSQNASLTPDQIARIVQQKQTVTPTLILASVQDALNLSGPGTPPNFFYNNALQNLVALRKAGVTILAGTDSNAASPRTTIPFGLPLHDELENLVAAGYTPAEAIRAATVVPARVYNLRDRGVIAPGKRADLILLNSNANPLANVTATRDIAQVWLQGIPYGSIAASSWATISTL